MFEVLLGRTLFGFAVRGIVFFMLILLIIFMLVFSGSKAHAASIDLALGDSIAVGTGNAMGIPTRAQKALGSCAIRDRFTPASALHMVISAGINDEGACVADLRARVKAARVTWILPAPINGGALAVWKVVKLYGDGFVSYTCKGGCTKRNFHPASYAVVAAAVRLDWGYHGSQVHGRARVRH